MLKKPDSCVGCALYSIGHGFSVPEGTGANGVLIMGEALGEQEAREGKPFRPTAPAGHVLEQAIKSLGMDRAQFALWNVAACQPPHNELLGASYEYAALEHCKVHTRRIIQQFKPRVILACGAIPTRVLTGLTGRKLRMEDLQGFALEAPDYPGIRVIPTYHPSYIQRGAWQVFPVLRLAIAKAVKLAREGWREEEFECNENATSGDVEEMAEELEKNPELDVNVDFETDGGEIEPDAIQVQDSDEDEEDTRESKGAISTAQKITQVNLCVHDGVALAVHFNDHSRSAVDRVLRTANNKHGHNWFLFDEYVAEFNGLVVNGRRDDSMWMFHHAYPDLPGSYKKFAGDTAKDQGSLASLQFCASFYGAPFPWKHMRLERGGYYGCLDGINGRRVFNGAKRDLIKLGCWESYETFVLRLRPILADAERRGIPVNRQKLREFIAMLEVREVQELAKLAPMIPECLQPSKQKSGLKKEPKDTTGYVKRSFFLLEPEKCGCVKTKKEKKCAKCKGTGALFGLNDEIVDCIECSGRGASEAITIPLEGCPICKGKGEVKGDVERWCQLLPFNADSPLQVKQYTLYEGPTPLGFKKRYTIPKNSKRKYAMDKETLERLAKTYKDPVYETIMTAKSVTKFKSVYGEGILKRLSLTDECLHAQFLFLPATGQISSTPNVQNFPHPGKGGALQREYATQFRGAIEAKPGHVLIELDYKSFHACTLAWESRDWSYLRLAKIDAHSYLTGFVKKLPGYRQALGWDDEKLSAWLADIKKHHEKERNEKFKVALLGWGFGLGGTRLYNTNPEAFTGIHEAMGVFDALDAAFPVTAQYRRDSPELAHRQKYLKSVFGCIRWFWNVKGFEFKKREWTHGSDWDKAIAFRPANDAFCQKKIALLRCKDKGYTETYGLVDDIHDSFLFHCPESLAEECIHNVREEMEYPSDVMLLADGSGFSVEVEEKIGRDWANMRSWKKWTN